MNWEVVFLTGVLPFIPLDIVKCIVAVILARPIGKFLIEDIKIMRQVYILGGLRSYIGLCNGMYRHIPAEFLGAKVLKKFKREI
mgnify:CR=1 FL=1